MPVPVAVFQVYGINRAVNGHRSRAIAIKYNVTGKAKAAFVRPGAGDVESSGTRLDHAAWFFQR